MHFSADLLTQTAWVVLWSCFKSAPFAEKGNRT